MYDYHFRKLLLWFIWCGQSQEVNLHLLIGSSINLCFMRVLVSSITKISCHQIKDMRFNPHLHQKLISVWPDDKEKSSWSKCYRLKFYRINKKICNKSLPFHGLLVLIFLVLYLRLISVIGMVLTFKPGSFVFLLRHYEIQECN